MGQCNATSGKGGAVQKCVYDLRERGEVSSELSRLVGGGDTIQLQIWGTKEISEGSGSRWLRRVAGE